MLGKGDIVLLAVEAGLTGCGHGIGLCVILTVLKFHSAFIHNSHLLSAKRHQLPDKPGIAHPLPRGGCACEGTTRRPAGIYI